MQVACVHINVKIYTCANLCVQSVLLCTESPPITLQRKEHQHVSRRSCNPCLNGIAPLWDFFFAQYLFTAYLVEWSSKPSPCEPKDHLHDWKGHGQSNHLIFSLSNTLAPNFFEFVLLCWGSKQIPGPCNIETCPDFTQLAMLFCVDMAT